MSDKKLPTVWILGGPGSGKGTLCDKIVSKYGFTHISTGDLLRDEVNTGSERGQELVKIMKEGALVPTSVVMELLKEKISSKLGSSKGFLIDGYPREKQQGEEFEKAIGPVDMILYLESDDDTMVQRLLKRAETSGRSDDNMETIKKRLATFHTHNDPIIEVYKSKTVTISAQQTAEAVFSEAEKSLDTIVVAV
ncbi:adenylate kinase isoenzyme 1 [Daktulosphaira vitifoliae]|uniref:adenylate kinase isoenzyme 1 n=1 Tax=Daktulosphaira vitifoliae TaxID=58002 RepID=UPI0021AAD531|nr:adenylate kinase isoenzyme 1 [Daktulosphaira vitifoliae]XP_050530657.1 adenylate kinase isoenzyme 1 [Daktulosphaira vitifoliae]XP_050530658.1 adenylate kinase isoenzyme 1 [Daktulosphaira vitifoliae]